MNDEPNFFVWAIGATIFIGVLFNGIDERLAVLGGIAVAAIVVLTSMYGDQKGE